VTRLYNPPPISWPLLPYPDDQGKLTYPDLEKSIRDCIKVILSTRPGEQLMRPRFGAGLQDFLDLSNTITVRRQIHDAVSHALELYEPRISVDRVDVDPVENAPAQLRVQVFYRLARTGEMQSLGVTLTGGS
jgi:phage baseplate assembly protein W